MTYGSRIKQAREDLRMTQEQLAEQLDISRQAVSKWEADLSRPTLEKLDRLSEILDIPPETWSEIDAELEAASRPPDTSRSWKTATAVLAAVCLILAVCLTAALWPRDHADQDGSPVPSEDDIQVVPLPDEDPDPPADLSEILPNTLPLTVSRDFDFGDWPLGEYDPDLVPFLDDPEQLAEHELWRGQFPDGTTLSLVMAAAQWDESGERSDMYLLYAPPAETGEPDYRILYRIGEDYMGDDDGMPEAGTFENALGYDGFKLTLSHAENFYRDSDYISQRPDGTPCLVTITSETGYEADIDDDGVLELVSFDRYLPGWNITDTAAGEEGAFIYKLDYHDLDIPDEVTWGFSPEWGGFVVKDSNGVAHFRYVLRDGELVRLPLTDFSALDYPDVAGTKITFITDYDQVGILTDEIDPDEILRYSEEVSVTHRQQAYLALQELYDLTGLKVDECCCTANEFDLCFSLLPDGFNQRSFFVCGFNTRCGNVDNIPSIHIAWRELGNDWSPLSLEEAVLPEDGMSEAEAMLWYYDRMEIFSTGEPRQASLGDLWLADGDLYVYYMEDTAYGPVLTSITGPYPNGEINH